MRWKKLYNDAGEEFAIVSECNRWQIAKYASSPRYCLFTREQLGKPFSVVACSDDSQKLRGMAADRSSAQEARQTAQS